MNKILVVYGTRPELIKLAPVIFALRNHPKEFDLVVCSTAQHREMLDQVETVFNIQPDLDLDLMRSNQSLNGLTTRGVRALDHVLRSNQPDLVLVQGDTTTVLATSLAAFHLGIQIGHVEAGLRTGDLQSPFPEEANRRVTDLMSDYLFCPTERSKRHLIGEGCEPGKIFVTGNTVVDALMWVAGHLPEEPATREVLVTVHRRESFGEPLDEILAAVRDLARSFVEFDWIFPVHRNPNVAQRVEQRLRGIGNVHLCDPLPYDELVRYLKRARLVLTDSGGLQEEAPTFGKPVLVLREKTERPEGIEAGISRLVGAKRMRIIEETTRLLTEESAYHSMSCSGNPFGDGQAAERIVAILAGEEPLPPFASGILKC